MSSANRRAVELSFCGKSFMYRRNSNGPRIGSLWDARHDRGQRWLTRFVIVVFPDHTHLLFLLASVL